ncbi:PhoX family phosphatase [Ramlibacter tataouinensis]|uniref:PhoX family protein n=1 Tax=Ramlibacter tataouinensis TaxID=94132 RepID=UPI0022F3E1F5|nr:PhoX family phosphatase [Ramlibacter tataouinensis]WBY00134.1 PhoX family phosphatase [Ramlibacter tataouinensis]
MNTSPRPERTALAGSDAENCNTSANPAFGDVLEARLSRRNALRLSVGSAGAAVLGTVGLSACGGGGDAAPPASVPLALNFAAVPKSTADAVSVPAGYTAAVLFALGDPIAAATPDYRNDGTDGDFDNRAGDHHDGMEYFGLNATGTARDAAGSTRGLLVQNHEATSHAGARAGFPTEYASTYVHANGGTNTLPRPAAEVDKEVALHGLSIIEVSRNAGRFSYDKASAYNRRVTPLTAMRISGPARGHALMKTKHSVAGTDARGTLNNCGTGTTPWGTFLTGEENFAGYFTRSATDNADRAAAGDARSVVSLNRYGRSQGAASRHAWETGGPADAYARWNISALAGQPADGSGDYRNELNTFGWVVEMDPYDKAQAIRKRTALGRFAHESATFGLRTAGKPLAVYMGDDSRGEYIYKFVSAAAWSEADANPANRITTGDKYLDSGRLYVAKFNADGSGDWIELDIANAAIAGYATYAFADQADVLVNARLAADAVGATKMDRPEWCAVHPVTGEIYYTLTNNSNRKVEPTGSQMAVDAANPRAYSDSYGGGAPGAPGNIHGHIIRMKEAGGEGAATRFSWDVYLFGAEAGADAARVNLSALTAEQDFSSPDGLWFSPKTGLCFIQTDDGAYTDVSNCMMLAGIPGQVGDGAVVPLEYTKADASKLVVNARVGAKPTAATLRRFLVGPVDCEITGITETPDGKALFVNIQHPGESILQADIADPSRYTSHWPGNAGYGAGGANARPRSATIVITRDDGGVIGVSGDRFLNNN